MEDVPTLTFEQRLQKLESQVGRIEAHLRETRNIITTTQDVVTRGNENRIREIDALKAEIDEIGECTMQTLFRVFPKQVAFLDEVDAVIDRRRKEPD
jgi:uncharacterized coiled-coil protein SlyX